MKKIIPILTGVCAVVCLLATVGLSVDFLTPAPAKTAKKYTAAIAKGNLKKAAKYSNSDVADAAGELGELLLNNSALTDLLDGSGVDMKKYRSAKILVGKPVYNEDKTSAGVSATVLIPGDSDTDYLSLSNNAGKWGVDD